MKFIRLQDALLSILFEDDDIIAIDKPYGFNAHTNDSKKEHSEFIQDGLIEIYEKQLNRKLHIIHRLDQTTTGVMLFGKSVESAKKYAEYFFNRLAKKTYLLVTKNKSTKDFFLIDKIIVHKAKELDAKTELRLLNRSKQFELWQANPLTGRNHQIRIHAEAAGLSILGDAKYEGADYPFLCLHNERIQFPNGIIISAQSPPYFNDLSLLEDLTLAKSFFQIDRRFRIFSDKQTNQTFRLIHNKNNPEVPGFTLDHFSDRMILNWYSASWTENENSRFTLLARFLKKPVVVRLLGNIESNSTKVFELPADPAMNTFITPWVTHEHDRNYLVQADKGASVGLFTNQRLQRQWIYNSVKDKTVLSLFSHTGTASVAAARGQARQVTSVDSSKTSLNWSRQNFELNQLDPNSFLFFCRDSLTFLQQALNKKSRYDLIICDVPSFYRREKGVFKIETDLQELIMDALQCLNLDGKILLSTNFDGFYIDTVRQIILKALNTLNLRAEINCLLPSLDFELPFEKANLKSFVIELNGSSNLA